MSSGFRHNAPAPISTGVSAGADDDYDYNALKYSVAKTGSGTPEERAYRKTVHKVAAAPPPPPSSKTPERVDGSDALLDLEQLEELHQEAEKMKALGNKHMAAQEFTRAYNAYSAALQLSPVGPSSHVFLSNRAAALLSLKRYGAAATDARRAVALAPTFGKAHARLGQALYFLKDYQGAVTAYEEALEYEPDNAVTKTYLEKARIKLAKQQARQQARSEEMSSVTEESLPVTVANSIATDTSGKAAVVQTTGGLRDVNKAILDAVARHQPPREVATEPNDNSNNLVSPLGEGEFEEPEDDPDFDEAVRIQQVANKLLGSKRYKEAIEQYSAALFLVPDDPYLSPELHLGRAHALNGLRRHGSARNDAMLAIKLQPTSEAYSTLAKTLFYLSDYQGAIGAFEQCMDLLPAGESLSMFDQAYLRKAEAAWQEELESNPDDAKSYSSKGSSVPKLPPPRFVPREKAITSAPIIPPMPKQWPQQSPASASSLQVGPERTVVIFSESLGIKLNRGTDGIVRVLSVTAETPGSPVARDGTIEVGDVVREAAGVDIRRPITNLMWGDTVALIKMAPRPISLIVAKETSEVPASVLDEMKRLTTSPASFSAQRGEEKIEELYLERPSPASGEESVRDSIAMANAEDALEEAAPQGEAPEEEAPEEDFRGGNVNDTVDFSDKKIDAGARSESKVKSAEGLDSSQEELSAAEANSVHADVLPESEDQVKTESEEREINDSCSGPNDDGEVGQIESNEMSCKQISEDEKISFPAAGLSPQDAETAGLSPQDAETAQIGGEILFERKAVVGPEDWSNLRWLSTAGMRKIRYCEVVTKLTTTRKGLFWSGESYVRRKLVIYDYPSLILLLRPPTDMAEVQTLLNLPDGVDVADGANTLGSFLVAETVIDPKTCKLKLSPLTTITSVDNSASESDDPRRRACLELVTPNETIVLSALPPKDDPEGSNSDLCSATSDMYLETAGLESAVVNALYHAHMPCSDPSLLSKGDMAWKHQIVQGTLHSFIVTGNQQMLKDAIKAALAKGGRSSKDDDVRHLPPQIIDERDECGYAALHYACLRRAGAAVAALIGAGANCSIPVGPSELFPSHLSALMLDEKSLSTILSASYPMRPDPNALDAFGRTPMYLASVAGKAVGGGDDDVALERCLSALEAWGGQMLINEFSTRLHHPVSYLASRWRSGGVAVVLAHIPHLYPLETCNSSGAKSGISLGALFHYPVHAALVTLRKKIDMIKTGDKGHDLICTDRTPESPLLGTIRVLLENGFEPNERLEGIADKFDGQEDLAAYTGYAPIQILASAALDLDSLSDSLGAALKQASLHLIAGLAELLVRNGARLSLDPPPTTRPTRLARGTSTGSSSVVSEDSELADEASVEVHNHRDKLKIESSRELVSLLGGEERLRAAKDYFSEIKSVESWTGKFKIHKQKSKASVSGSEAPGGSDEKSCAVCWKAFGKLRNRKHRCRVTNRHVCEDCSTKRIVTEGEEHRVSDGQFLLARVEAAKQEAVRLAEEEEKARIEKLRAEQVEERAAARRADMESSNESNRDSLFGGVMEKAASYVFGEEGEERDPENNKIESLTSKMSQTKDALHQRGDKLNSLSEKTTKLKESSMEFARLAKELNRAQKSGFW